MQAHGVTEMNFGLHTGTGRPQAFAEIYCGMSLHRHGVTASVRRNLFRHEFAQARGNRKRSPNLLRHEFAQARGDCKRSPKFISA
jgi:hypothetical protein